MIRKTKKLFAIMITICIMITSNLTTLAVEDIKNGEEIPIDGNVSSEYININEIQELTNEVEESFETVNANNMEREYQGEQTKISKPMTNSRVANYASYDNTDPNYAYLVENDNVIQGAIATNYQERWYAFELNEKNKATILLQMTTGLDVDLYMFKLDTSTYQLSFIGGSANAGSNDEYYTDTLENGIYYFAVAGYSGTGNFAFGFYQSTRDVNYEVNDSLSYASNIPLSTNIVGVIDNHNDKDYYKFTITNPVVMRYSISTVKDYTLEFVGSQGTGSSAYSIGGNLIKLNPGTYYFSVESPTGAYSSSITYTINFKKIADIANDSSAPLLAISETAGIVFQSDSIGSNCYVNGNPIDYSYSYYQSMSNSAGSQVYDIKIENRNDVYINLTRGVLEPSVVHYLYSSKPNISVPSKALLEVTLRSNTDFYRIHCRGTGSYAANSLWVDTSAVIVFIDPNTGKLVDISEYNYFYQFATGSNSITYTRPYNMIYNYD